MPGMIKVCVASSATVFVPRTVATTTTASTGFRDSTAFGAYGTGNCCGCSGSYVEIGQRYKKKLLYHCLVCARSYLHGINVGLTFAGLQALRPPVTNVSVACSSTVIIPSTARSTATGSARFLEHTALWARHLVARGDGWRSRVDWCGD